MNVLEITDLKRSFVAPDGQRQLIIDIPQWSMPPGRQIALVGESGMGKTTLLNLIAGILRPDAGSIILNGENMTAYSEARRDQLRARTIGYVFQTFNLLQGYTALENVELAMMFGRGADRAYARALLERVGLSQRMYHRPRQMSVGQQQRVAVARAMANRPKLVLADEPTGNLDLRTAADALKLMRDICAEHNAALLIVTHDQRVIDQFEHVQRLDDINRAVAQTEATSAT